MPKHQISEAKREDMDFHLPKWGQSSARFYSRKQEMGEQYYEL